MRTRLCGEIDDGVLGVGDEFCPVRSPIIRERQSREPHGARLGSHEAVHGARIGVVEWKRVAGVEATEGRLVRELAVLAVDACLFFNFGGLFVEGRKGKRRKRKA